MYILITFKEISANSLKKLEKFSGIVELFVFYNMIDVLIELWCDEKDSWKSN